MRVLAIDPGLHAAACMYQPTASLRSGMRWQFLEVPVIPGRKRPDARVLRDWIMRHGPADRAFVENVSGMPGDGVEECRDAGEQGRFYLLDGGQQVLVVTRVRHQRHGIMRQ